MQKELYSILTSYDTIVFVGGGTGWHISPIIALAEELKGENISMYWIGWKHSEEERQAHIHAIDFYGIPVLKLTNTTSLQVLRYPFKSIQGIHAARKIFKKLKKDSKKIAVFSKWWPGALAIGIAAKSLNIPLYIHESDVIPGKSNAFLAPFAKNIFLGFERAKSHFPVDKCITIGQIIDKRLYDSSVEWGIVWKTKKPHILVLCGSQWAKKVFEAIIKHCSKIDAEWIVVLGKLNTQMREEFASFKHIQVLDWLDKNDQKTVFESTDVVVTRWSATTLAELELFQIPKIIIPLPSAASNHQYYNAKEYEKNGDIVLLQKNIDWIKTSIMTILHS